MQVIRTAQFNFTKEEVKAIRNVLDFFLTMSDDDFDDLLAAANVPNADFFEGLDNIHSFMCDNMGE
jgi:hypothetical protein